MKNKIIIKIILIIVIIYIFLISTFIITFSFLNTHFHYNVQINGIDCSFSTVKQAKEKINQQIALREIYIKFANNIVYKIPSESIGLYLEDTKELEQILKVRNLRGFFKEKEYTLQKSLIFDEAKMMNYLKSLPEFNKEVVLAKNAFLNFDEKSHTINIVSGTIGNVESVEKAFQIAKDTLQKGKTIIDFTVYPEIIESNEELIQNQNRMNNILKTTIHYKLRNGKIVTLDWNNWVKRNKQGNWNIEIGNNLKEFVDSLNKKVKQANSTCTFKATGIGNIKLYLRSSLREQINTDEEKKKIKQLLETGKTYHVEPTYIKSNYEDALSNYLEIDLTRQKVWLYRNGRCIVSGKCVSGSISGGHATPTGMFYLDYKTTDTYLRGRNNDGSRYNSHVNYWMPFNGGIGLHDATWRSRFGGTIYRYNGSHGCINLPYSVAKKIYENINYKTLIIVYKS